MTLQAELEEFVEQARNGVTVLAATSKLLDLVQFPFLRPEIYNFPQILSILMRNAELIVADAGAETNGFGALHAHELRWNSMLTLCLLCCDAQNQHHIVHHNPGVLRFLQRNAQDHGVFSSYAIASLSFVFASNTTTRGMLHCANVLPLLIKSARVDYQSPAFWALNMVYMRLTTTRGDCHVSRERSSTSCSLLHKGAPQRIYTFWASLQSAWALQIAVYSAQGTRLPVRRLPKELVRMTFSMMNGS